MQSILPSGEDSTMTVQSATGVMFMDFKETALARRYENLGFIRQERAALRVKRLSPSMVIQRTV
jgi:hypothetical protein